MTRNHFSIYPLVGSHIRFLILGVLLWSGCFKEDKPLERPPIDQDQKTIVLPMTSAYDQEFFFDCAKAKVVGSSPLNAWDLAFDAQPGKSHVYLNGGKSLFVANVGSDKPFESIQQIPLDAQWRWDDSEGSAELLAFQGWGRWENNVYVSNDDVYIIERKITVSGEPNRRWKVQFRDLEDDSYTIRIADLNGRNDTTVTLRKDARFNRVYLHLHSRSIIQREPPKTDYDLIFTRYTYTFEEEDSLAYLVTGVLLNPHQTKALRIYDMPYDSITIERALRMPLTSQQDIIGYDWKTYSFESNSYSIVSDAVFVIRNQNGFFFRMKFIDFYNEFGERGHPTFWVQGL